MKIIKVMNFFQSSLKYSEHYLYEKHLDQGIDTLIFSTDKIQKTRRNFIDLKSFHLGYNDNDGYKKYRIKAVNNKDKIIFIDFISFYSFFKNNSYDVVHIVGIGNFLTFYTVILLKLILKKQVPIVITEASNFKHHQNGFIAKYYYRLMNFLFKKLNKYIDLVYHVNFGTKDYLLWRYGEAITSKLKYIPLGYSSDIYKINNIERTSERFHVGFAGKIEERKKLEKLINSINKLSFKNEIVLHLIGFNKDKPSEYQTKLIEYVKKQNFTINMGKIKSPHELAKFYNSMNLVVFPGSISVTTIEANACGCPVLIYKYIDHLEDRVENGRGYLFETEEELEERIEEYYYKFKNCEINYESIAEETKKTSWDNIANKYIKSYYELRSKYE